MKDRNELIGFVGVFALFASVIGWQVLLYMIIPWLIDRYL